MAAVTMEFNGEDIEVLEDTKEAISNNQEVKAEEKAGNMWILFRRR